MLSITNRKNNEIIRLIQDEILGKIIGNQKLIEMKF